MTEAELKQIYIDAGMPEPDQIVKETFRNIEEYALPAIRDLNTHQDIKDTMQKQTLTQ